MLIGNAGEAYAADTHNSTVAIGQTLSLNNVLQKTIDATVKVEKPEKTVEDLVREYFADTPVLAEVARCESNFRQFVADGKVLRGIVDSRDVGVMQINEYYHLSQAKKLGYDIYTIEGNMAYAKYIYGKSGSQPWKASSPCWGKKVALLNQKSDVNTQVALK